MTFLVVGVIAVGLNPGSVALIEQTMLQQPSLYGNQTTSLVS